MNTTPLPMPPDPTTGLPAAFRHLLTEQEFGDVVYTVLDNNPGMADDTARRITAETIAFVATCVAFPDARIAPSPVVDEGWHALILHTALYARICERLGAFVNHYPERPTDTGYDADVIARTVETMKKAGFTPDSVLWAGPDAGLIEVSANVWHSPPEGPIVIIPRPKPGSAPIPV